MVRNNSLSLFEEVDKWLDHMNDLANRANGVKYPPNEHLWDEDGNAVLRFALAGWKKDDIEVVIDDDHLLINGTYQKDKSKKVVSSTIAYRNFNVKYKILSSKFDIENIKVTFENGMLEIFVPILEKQKPKKITIN